MKTLFITAILCTLTCGLYSQGQYWQQVPSPVTKTIKECFFLDTTYGWAVGDSGVIIHTSNGGQNWAEQNSGISAHPIQSVFFLNANTGWALCNDFLFFGTMILRTTNGGQNWSNTRHYDTTQVFEVLHFLNAQTGFITGYSGQIFKTTNGGTNWNQTHIDTAFCSFLYLFPKRGIDFQDANTGFAAGGQIDIQGIIWRTTDAGANWYTYCVTPEPMEDIKVLSPGKILAAGGDFEYGTMTATTYDGGNSWIYNPTGVFGAASDIALRTPSELWLPLTFGAKWAVNLDTGRIGTPWYEIPTADTSLIYAVDFKSPTFGWSFGSHGRIYKYNKDIIGLSDPSNNLPLKHKLYQNYPNPFNPSTTIQYYLAKKEFVRVTIYDLTGRMIETVIEGYRPQGYNKFKFNALGLASGIYICKLEAGELTETRKMVLLK